MGKILGFLAPKGKSLGSSRGVLFLLGWNGNECGKNRGCAHSGKSPALGIDKLAKRGLEMVLASRGETPRPQGTWTAVSGAASEAETLWVGNERNQTQPRLRELVYTASKRKIPALEGH